LVYRFVWISYKKYQQTSNNVQTQTAGAASTLIYYDQLDREIRRETVGFDGTAIYINCAG